jgi:hypothetical protein
MEDFYVEDFEEFMEWWAKLGPNELLDMNEAMTVYFNQDIYGETI